MYAVIDVNLRGMLFPLKQGKVIRRHLYVNRNAFNYVINNKHANI